MSKRTGISDDPNWRRERARRAGLALGQKRAREREARIAAYPDKWAAYDAGYKAGKRERLTCGRPA